VLAIAVILMAPQDRGHRKGIMSRICVLGGSGFIGSALCAALARDGHTVTMLTRRAARARHLGVLPGIRVVEGDPHHRPTLVAVLPGHDVLVNLVGILNESGRDGSGFRRAHTALAAAAVDACGAAGVQRLLHMSSLGADADRGPSHYLRSKGAAEQLIRSSGPDLRWTIFRPSVVFGDGDSFTNRFAALLRLLPVLPLARPDARFAPVWVGDVVAAFRRALDDNATVGEIFELCGPQVMGFREVVTFVRDALGLRRLIVGLPDPLSRLQATVMDFVPGKPFSTDNYLSLTIDSVCTSNGFARLGLVPHSLELIAPAYLTGERNRNTRFTRWREHAGR
jgi:NADH dehydrogenase